MTVIRRIDAAAGAAPALVPGLTPCAVATPIAVGNAGHHHFPLAHFSIIH
jgi:enoyl reductase-like protein